MNTLANVMFEAAYEKWMEEERKNSRGERRRRLTEVGNHAEKLFLAKVWWPSFGHFANLSAEYEVKDFKDGRRYLDFAYHTAGHKICMEIDGYGPHWRDLDRQQFADQLIRQNHLVIDGWIVLRFSFDDIRDKPRRCQQIVQQLIGRLSGANTVRLQPIEKAFYDLACFNDAPITPSQAACRLGIHRKTAAKYMRGLKNKGMLIPLSQKSEPENTVRTSRYQVASADFQRFNFQ